MIRIEQILCSLSLAWPSGGAQASRVLNQCNQLNLLTKKDIQLIMQISVFTCNQLTTVLFSLAALVEQHPSKLVLHSLAGALTLIINTMKQN